MKHIDTRDLTAGALMVALGLFVALYARGHYKVGELDRMGPGFFPMLLGWLLVGLGVIIALLAFRKTVHILKPPPLAWRALVAILAAILVFSLLVERLGLVPAALAMTFTAVFAERPIRWRRTVLLGCGLALISWLIFSVGLKMTLPAFTFLG
jgi:hypothetical protein